MVRRGYATPVYRSRSVDFADLVGNPEQLVHLIGPDDEAGDRRLRDAGEIDVK